ncbi:MAG: DUF167 family protein [Desulfobacterales bacterium]|nr:DUF167 family protein [Desulfobacterales bacterium]
MSYLRSDDNGVLLTLYIQPRASRTRFQGRHGDALKLAVTAPPVDNRANAMVIDYLAKFFCLPKSAVTIKSGLQSRTKQVQLARLSPAEVRAVLDRDLAR